MSELFWTQLLQSDSLAVLGLGVLVWRLLPHLVAISTRLAELQTTLQHGLDALGHRLNTLEDRVAEVEEWLHQPF